MLTDRDYEIINFIDTFKAVSGKHIQQVFKISQTITNRRLKQIIKAKEAQRIRDHCTMNYLYFTTEKPTRHKLIVTGLYSKFVRQVEIIKFEREYKLGSLRPDIFCECKKNGYHYFLFIEIQLSNSELNIQKYEDYYYSNEWNELFKIFPRIIVISDKNYKINSPLKIIQIDTKLLSFNQIFNI